MGDYLNNFLNCPVYDDFTVNGLQVEGKEEIRRVVTGVSPSKRLFDAASKWKADAVILHHGLFWKRGTPHPFHLTGVLRQRVASLIKRDINLFAYHLPLDGHETLGNNALIAGEMGLKSVEIIAETGWRSPLIAIGNLTKPVAFAVLCKSLDKILSTKGRGLKLAKAEVGRVAIVTGGGSSCWKDAAAAGADLLITGEIHESDVREAEEGGINLYAGGHYNTEKWGVRALGEHLAGKFDLEVKFIDIPNPI